MTDNITLFYGPPEWHKMSILAPVKNIEIGPGGVTKDLIVAVRCDNGVEFISMDRYDVHTESWEKHTSDNGQHVLAWCDMKVPW